MSTQAFAAIVTIAASLLLGVPPVIEASGVALAADERARFNERFPSQAEIDAALPSRMQADASPADDVNIPHDERSNAPTDAMGAAINRVDRKPTGGAGLYVSELPLGRFLERTEGGIQRWSAVATRAAEGNGLPSDFFIRLLSQESGFKPTVISKAGAQGIAQFMPATAIAVGLKDPFDPESAIHASAAHLASLVKRFGNVGLAAAAYNAGPERVSAWLAGRKGLPSETRNYVRRITGLEVENWAGPRAALIAPVVVQTSPSHSAKVASTSKARRRGGAAANLCLAINATGAICRVQGSY